VALDGRGPESENPVCRIRDSSRLEVALPRPIRRSTNRLVEEVHERVLEMIAIGELAPNGRLHQGHLAEQLGVSRTPVREALLRLEREGLVDTQPGRGMFVKEVTVNEVREIYELREALEPFGARLACERATSKDVEEIERIQRRHETRYPSDLGKAFRSNYELHTSLVRPCGNALLLRVLRNAWHQDAAFRIFAFYTADRDAVARMVPEHRQIVDAFAARDPDKVEELLHVHIRDAFEALMKRVEEMEGSET
jgi:DNA-binding GntR family transcriptional regulator